MTEDPGLDQLVSSIKALRLEWQEAGYPMFLGIPDAWYDGHKFRCPNNHVSRTILKTDRGDACLACGAPVVITFPTDEDGTPLSGGLPPNLLLP